MSQAVITGVGLHCSLGGEEELLAALGEGRHGLRLHSLPKVQGLPPLPAAPAAPASPLEFLPDPKIAKYMSPVGALAVLAAGRALRRAGLLEDAAARSAMAIYLATGLIAIEPEMVAPLEVARTDDGALDLRRLGQEGVRRCHPLMPFKMLLNMPLGLTSIVFGLRGENGIYYPGAAQAGVALELGLAGLAQGRFERVLVGAVVQGVSLLPICGLARRGQLAASLEAARPQQPDHRGVAPGDGAVCLVLESERASRERGARPLAFLTAAGSGLLPEAGPLDRWPALGRRWQDLLPALPHAVLSSGSPDWQEDQRERAAVTSLAAGSPPALLNLDGVVGQLGPASLLLGLALSALMHERGELIGLPGAPLAAPLLASALDEDGGWAAAATTSVGAC